MAFTYQTVTLDAERDEEGVLIFRDGRLVAVVSQLSEMHGDLSGRWFVEAGFGAFFGTRPPPFEALGQVEEWFADPPLA